jgi:Ca2+-binding RTX toxin-like protein
VYFGYDTLDYAGTTEAVTVNLGAGTGTGFTAIAGVESVWGGSGNDLLIGDAGANNLVGNAGLDTLIGGDGSDNLNGGGGADSLDGGAGDDWLNGSDGADHLTGGPGADTFAWSTADPAAIVFGDRITDWESSDWIHVADLDANTSIDGNQDFTFLGLGSADQTVGQGELKYYYSGGNTFLVGNATPDNQADFQIEINGEHALTIDDFFGVVAPNAAPSTPTDSDAAANSVAEGAASGTTVGLTASATNIGGGTITYSLTDDAGGRFAIDPNTGVVTVADGTLLDYETATSHQITAQASDGTASSTQTFLIAVTNVAPTVPADTDAALNTIAEGAENGTSVGIWAQSADPGGGTVIYSLTDDAGGRFVIDPRTGWVTVLDGTLLDFETATSQQITVAASDGVATTAQTFTIDVSNVNGTTLTGRGFADTLTGTSEDDTLDGGSGADTLNGLAGDDLLIGGAGTDTMNGGLGNDTYVVANTTDIVNENPGEGTDLVQSSVTYTISDADVENLVLTGTGTINGTGNATTNTITGNTGNNFLAGLGGADVLNGGAGTDTATYAASTSGINVSLATGTATGGDAAGDSFVSIENLTGSGFNDTLEGSFGTNVLNGGAGIDTLSYANADAGVNVSLANTAVQNTGGAGTDTLSGFENLTGSAFNDTLRGTSGNNVMTGLAGNDTLTGNGGNDTFVFDVGADTITDFSAGAAVGDVIQFDSSIFADFDAVIAASTNVGANVVIDAGDGNTLTLNAVQIATLNANDFLFV